MFERLAGAAVELTDQARFTCAELALVPCSDDFQKFVLISTIRTGSTMLSYMLQDHPEICMFHEIFHMHEESIPFSRSGFRAKSKDPNALKLRKNDPKAFLDTVVFATKPARFAHVGFNLIYTQGRTDNPFWLAPEFDHWWPNGRPPRYGSDENNVWKYIRDTPEMKIIHLTREDLLAQYVSAEIAKQTGAWGTGTTGGYKSDDGVKIRINPDHAVQHIIATERMQQEVRTMFSESRVLEVTYEQLVHHGILANICEFLGVRPLGVIPRTQKQSTQRLSAKIEEFDALSAAMSRANLSRYLPSLTAVGAVGS